VGMGIDGVVEVKIVVLISDVVELSWVVRGGSVGAGSLNRLILSNRMNWSSLLASNSKFTLTDNTKLSDQ